MEVKQDDIIGKIKGKPLNGAGKSVLIDL